MPICITKTFIAAAFAFAVSLAQPVLAETAKSGPEETMREFLLAFVAGDYDACHALLAPDATITIKRSYQGGPIETVHQSAAQWLNEVGATGVKEIEGFAANIHESAGLVHEHGAVAVVRFTASGMTGRGAFRNLGFDTGNLVNTPEGWRIVHYSSFEDFRWDGDAQSSN